MSSGKQQQHRRGGRSAGRRGLIKWVQEVTSFELESHVETCLRRPDSADPSNDAVGQPTPLPVRILVEALGHLPVATLPLLVVGRALPAICSDPGGCQLAGQQVSKQLCADALPPQLTVDATTSPVWGPFSAICERAWRGTLAGDGTDAGHSQVALLRHAVANWCGTRAGGRRCAPAARGPLGLLRHGQLRLGAGCPGLRRRPRCTEPRCGWSRAARRAPCGVALLPGGTGSHDPAGEGCWARGEPAVAAPRA